MEQSIKQRIVGIAVLLIAAVVLLPALFDGEGSYPLPLESRIPAPTPFPDAPRVMPERPVMTADTSAIRIDTNPTLEAVEEEVPEPVAQDQVLAATPAPENPAPSETPAPVAAPATASTPASTPAPASTPTPAATPASPPAASTTASLDNTGLPQGWSVRLASFSSQTNARNLVERLQNAGHRAYTRQLSSSQGPLTAVFVGPDVDRAAAQRLLLQLQQEYQLTGIVVRYEIEEL